MMIIILIIAALTLVAAIALWMRFGKAPTIDISAPFERIEKNLERMERMLREEIAANRGEQLKSLQGFMHIHEQRFDQMRETIDRQLKHIQEDNANQLEKMRATVDEKLQATLEKRLGESFQLVSDRLERVHQGLGEMQQLASGVGDLKKVLTNVKVRGSWGEAQLGNLLEQILTPEQYERNVATKPKSRDVVEYAIKLPGDGVPVYLPIDAKFPTEDYERLIVAQDKADLEAMETASKGLDARFKLEAKTIREKYIEPPFTTDFAILYVPNEGLYAYVLSRPGLADTLRAGRVLVTGPSTIAALLNSLQMGFRTLAVEKRASEVWSILSTVKLEFGRFGDLLEKTKEKLDQASKTIDDASRKSRTIEKKLGDVEHLPTAVVKENLIDG